MHQIHFLVKSQDNYKVNGSQVDATIQNQVIDTIQIPFWDGNSSHPFPLVTVRMDFRGANIGDFVYHCHIAEHEDDGMMAIIRVEPSWAAAAVERFRLRLALFGESIGLLHRPSAARVKEIYAWCIRGKIVPRRTAKSDPRTNARLIAQALQ
jgi:Multicopper oxidase